MTWQKWGFVIGLLLMVFVWQQWPDGRLKIVFCDVGQGDGAVVVLGVFQAVVDTGASATKIGRCLSDNMPFWDREIEILFLSHGDKDHSGALDSIKKWYKVDRIVDKPKVGDIVRYDALVFNILKGNELVEGLNESRKQESNETSVVMKLVFGNFSVLFTGDLPSDSESALIGLPLLKNTDVLKVSHHGSKYSSSLEFLEAVKPKLAVISVGAKNNYGHPNGDVLLRLDVVGAKILRTDQRGSIRIVTDGKSEKIYSEK